MAKKNNMPVNRGFFSGLQTDNDEYLANQWDRNFSRSNLPKLEQEGYAVPIDNDTVNNNGVLDWAVDAAQAGFAGAAKGTFDWLRQYGPESLSDILKSGSDSMSEIVQRNTPLQELEGEYKVAWNIGQGIGSSVEALAELGAESAVIAGVASGVGSLLSATGLASAVGLGAKAVQGATGLAKIDKATEIANILRKTPGVGRVFEAAEKMWKQGFLGKAMVLERAGAINEAKSEAGNLIAEMEAQGYTPDEIYQAGLWSTAENAAWLTLTNYMEGLAMQGLLKLTPTVAKGAAAATLMGQPIKRGLRPMLATAAKAAGINAPIEGLEEAGQTVISAITPGIAQGNGVDLSKVDLNELKESAIAGAEAGGFLGGLGGAVQSFTSNNRIMKVGDNVIEAEPTKEGVVFKVNGSEGRMIDGTYTPWTLQDISEMTGTEDKNVAAWALNIGDKLKEIENAGKIAEKQKQDNATANIPSTETDTELQQATDYLNQLAAEPTTSDEIKNQIADVLNNQTAREPIIELANRLSNPQQEETENPTQTPLEEMGAAIPPEQDPFADAPKDLGNGIMVDPLLNNREFNTAEGWFLDWENNRWINRDTGEAVVRDGSNSQANLEQETPLTPEQQSAEINNLLDQEEIETDEFGDDGTAQAEIEDAVQRAQSDIDERMEIFKWLDDESKQELKDRLNRLAEMYNEGRFDENTYLKLQNQAENEAYRKGLRIKRKTDPAEIRKAEERRKRLAEYHKTPEYLQKKEERRLAREKKAAEDKANGVTPKPKVSRLTAFFNKLMDMGNIDLETAQELYQLFVGKNGSPKKNGLQQSREGVAAFAKTHEQYLADKQKRAEQKRAAEEKKKNDEADNQTFKEKLGFSKEDVVKGKNDGSRENKDNGKKPRKVNIPNTFGEVADNFSFNYQLENANGIKGKATVNVTLTGNDNERNIETNVEWDDGENIRSAKIVPADGNFEDAVMRAFKDSRTDSAEITATPTGSKRIEVQKQDNTETFVIEAKNELEDEALGLILDFDVDKPMVAESVEQEKPAEKTPKTKKDYLLADKVDTTEAVEKADENEDKVLSKLAEYKNTLSTQAKTAWKKAGNIDDQVLQLFENNDGDVKVYRTEGYLNGSKDYKNYFVHDSETNSYPELNRTVAKAVAYINDTAVDDLPVKPAIYGQKSVYVQRALDTIVPKENIEYFLDYTKKEGDVAARETYAAIGKENVPKEVVSILKAMGVVSKSVKNVSYADMCCKVAAYDMAISPDMYGEYSDESWKINTIIKEKVDDAHANYFRNFEDYLWEAFRPDIEAMPVSVTEQFDDTIRTSLDNVGKQLDNYNEGEMQEALTTIAKWWNDKSKMPFADVIKSLPQSIQKFGKFLTNMVKNLPKGIKFAVKEAMTALKVIHAAASKGIRSMQLKQIMQKLPNVLQYATAMDNALDDYPTREDGKANNVDIRRSDGSVRRIRTASDKQVGSPDNVQGKKSGDNDGGQGKGPGPEVPRTKKNIRGGTDNPIAPGGTAPGGAQGDKQTPGKTPRPGGNDTGDNDGNGSGRPGGEGNGADESETARVSGDDAWLRIGNGPNARYYDSRTVVGRKALSNEIKELKTKIKQGSADNVQQVLSVLKRRVGSGSVNDNFTLVDAYNQDQINDVKNGEKRLFDKNQKGMLHANGTGTGKTAVGLGYALRSWLAGKRRILVVVPSQAVGDSWSQEIRNLMLDDRMIMGDDAMSVNVITNDRPRSDAINIITYSSLQTNDNLLKASGGAFDLVIADEAHTLGSGNESREGKITNYLTALRAITGYEDGNGFNYWQSLYTATLRAQSQGLENAIKKLGKKKSIKDALAGQKIPDAARIAIANSTPEGALKSLEAEKVKIDAEIAKWEHGGVVKHTFNEWKRAADKTKTVFLSATPFSYASSIHWGAGYLFDYNELPGFNTKEKNKEKAFAEYLMDTFGYNSKMAKDPSVDSTDAEVAFHNLLADKGSMTSRRMAIDKDYSRKFLRVNGTLATDIDKGFSLIETDASAMNSGLYQILRDRYLKGGTSDTFIIRRVLEAIKARAGFELAKQYLAEGKNVIVAIDTKNVDRNGKSKSIPAIFKLSKKEYGDLSDIQKAAYDSIMQKYGTELERIDKEVSELQHPIDYARSIFYRDGEEPMVVTGQTSNAEVTKIVNSFNEGPRFNGQGKLLIGTTDKIKEGISMHDNNGKAKRVLINIGIPLSPTDLLQLEGRIYRLGSKSNAQYRYLSTYSNLENLYFSRIVDRNRTAENFAFGSEARPIDKMVMMSYLNGAENDIIQFDGSKDNVDSGDKRYESFKDTDLDKTNRELLGKISGNTQGIRLSLEDETNVSQAELNKVLTPENEKQVVESIKDIFFAKNVEQLGKGTWLVRLPNALSLVIDTTKNQMELLGKIAPADLQRIRKYTGVKNGTVLRGMFKVEPVRMYDNDGNYTGDVMPVSLINLTEWANSNTLPHEAFHFIYSALLNDTERNGIIRYFGNVARNKVGAGQWEKMTAEEKTVASEEAAADAFANFVKQDRRPRNAVEKVLWQIQKFVTKLKSLFGLADDKGNVMATFIRAREQSMFNREGNPKVASAISKHTYNVGDFIKEKDGAIRFQLDNSATIGDKADPNNLTATVQDAKSGLTQWVAKHRRLFGFADNTKTFDGNDNITIKDTKTGTDEDKFSGFDVFLSPSRLAEKYKDTLGYFVKVWDKAYEVQEKLRSIWGENQHQKALDQLKTLKDHEDYQELMLKGEMFEWVDKDGQPQHGKRFDAQELKDMQKAFGYSDNVIKAYNEVRDLLDDIWEVVNQVHRRMDDKAKSNASYTDIQELKNDKFIDNITIEVKNLNGEWVRLDKIEKDLNLSKRYDIRWKAPKIFKETVKLTAEQLKENDYANSPYVKIVKQERVEDISDGLPMFRLEIERVMPSFGYRQGYLTHFFEQWFVAVQDNNGKNTIVGSGRTLNEAGELAVKMNEALKAQGKPEMKFLLMPKLFDAGRLFGVDKATGGKAENGDIVATDNDSELAKQKLQDSFSMSLNHWQKTKGKKIRYRFWGNKYQRQDDVEGMEIDTETGEVETVKGVGGYNKDVEELVQRYIVGASRYVAMQPAKSDSIVKYEEMFNLAWDDEVNLKDNAVAAMCKFYINRCNGTPGAMEKIVNKTLNSFDWWNKNVVANYGDRSALALGNKATHFVGTAKLGFGNMSSALVNLLQSANTFAFVGKYLGDGIKKFAMLKSNKLSAKDKALAEKVIEETGVLYQITQGDTSSYTKRRLQFIKNAKGTFFERFMNGYWYLADKGMYLFNESEAANRQITVLAAYEKAIADGKTHEQAIEWAKTVNRKCNFEYGVNDTPMIMSALSGTGFGEMMMLFHKYTVKQLELMYEMFGKLIGGAKGDKTALAESARFWGLYFLLSGISGCPGLDWFDEYLKKILGYKPSARAKLWMLNEFGDNAMTRSVCYGIGAMPVNGVDISRRVGMGDAITGDASSLFAYLTGAPGSMLSDIVTAAGTGDLTKIAKAYSPTFGNLMEAWRGYKTDSKGRINARYETVMDKVLHGIGLRTTKESITSDMATALREEREQYMSDRQKVMYQCALKQLDPDSGGLTADDRTQLRALNITPKNLLDAKRKLQQTAAERLKGGLSKRQKQLYGSVFTKSTDEEDNEDKDD